MKKLAIAALATLLTSSAFAAQGDILARFRVTNVNPETSVDKTLEALKVDVKDDTIPEVDFTYMLTNNVGVELILGTSKHTLTAGGADIGSVKVLPPTVTAQYHFNPQGEFRPYVGAGVNYTRFYSLKDKSGLKLTVDKNSFGPALQVGMDTPLTKDIFLNFDVKKIWIKTKVKAGGADAGTLDINPLVTSVGIGTKF
ncbi:OmpW family protein [Vogesella sp. XCS3]|uniref:OmpW/AlkL family protein n=1 Tax=Vogesella sp. XCS3 TaxID=2877939 RepID=UPI0003684F1F|nr:OmpW family outer membrane protein [Vogesella sp. XCS3]MBP7580976.1 OmpW family protein [Vogesella sp.]UDM16498.1 outer membrane beta-barrel protein [Vogesella sp. XCS3]